MSKVQILQRIPGAGNRITGNHKASTSRMTPGHHPGSHRLPNNRPMEQPPDQIPGTAIKKPGRKAGKIFSKGWKMSWQVKNPVANPAAAQQWINPRINVRKRHSNRPLHSPEADHPNHTDTPHTGLYSGNSRDLPADPVPFTDPPDHRDRERLLLLHQKTRINTIRTQAPASGIRFPGSSSPQKTRFIPILKMRLK